MAVVTRKSGVITNRDATPRVFNNPGAARGRVVNFSGTLETVSGDSIASTYILASIPSNAVMRELKVYCDDIGTTTVADFGLYQTTENGGAVVSATVFASAVVLNAGALNGTDILFEAAGANWEPAKCETRVFEALGLATDPSLYYDLVATLTAAADAAATLSVIGSYAI